MPHRIYICPTCGFACHSGEFDWCPVCNPDYESDKCDLLDKMRGNCSLDHKPCPYVDGMKFNECKQNLGEDDA